MVDRKRVRQLLESPGRIPKSKKDQLKLSLELFREAVKAKGSLQEKMYTEAYEQVASRLAGSLTEIERRQVLSPKRPNRSRILNHPSTNVRPLVYHTLSLEEILNSRNVPLKSFSGTTSDRVLLAINKVREDQTLSQRAKLDYLNLLQLKAESNTSFGRGLKHTAPELVEKYGRSTQDRFDYLVNLLEKDVLVSPGQGGKMKVLRVSHDYNRNVGGLQKHLQELNAELNKQRGLEVHQVVPISRIDLRRMVREGKVQDRGGSYFDVDSQTEIHPIFVDHTPGDKIIRLNNRSVSRKYMGQMMKIFGKLNPDIVHVHNGYYRPHRDIAKVAKDKGKKVVHTWHGGKISADRLRKIHDETAGIADYNFAISNTGRLAFSDSRERKKVEIAYGVDLSRFDPVKVRKEDTNKLRRKLGIMKDDFVYFFPGRYDNQKNQSGLIEAFANVAKKDSKTKLVLAGQRFDGGHGKGYMDRLTKLADKYGIRDKIVFNDRIESLDKLRDYYAMSDAVVYPSRNEGRGRSLVEAMAMGKPVLASGDAGLRDSIETNRGHMGLLFDPDSLESIVGSMHRVKNNPVLREDLALKAGKYARAELDIGPYAKKYFDLYRNLASAV